MLIAKEDQIAAQLDRIVSSELFASAGRLAPFLRFVVETTVGGRAAELKESTIGVGVFGRPADYDPRVDPIVRVEARRLRSRLADYYAGPGSDDPVVIEMPKGSYVPVFTVRECTPAPKAASLPLWIPVAAVAVVAIVVWFAMRRGTPAPTSVAVLPFVNVSSDAANEYFSDGLTDELIDSLSRIPGLKVVGRGLVFQQKGKQYDVQALARQWNVGAVVEGSVRKNGDRLRITAQLTNAVDGYNLWSETYDRNLKDVFAIQQEIAASIARGLRVRLSQKAAPPPSDVRAYNHLLEARYHFNQLSRKGFELAFRSLDEAIRVDPQYAPAYTARAQMYGMAGYYYVMPPAEAWAKARQAAEQALRIDRESAGAHAAMGFVLGLNEWKWTESEREFQRALELDSSSAEVHAGYAVACLMPQARLNEAVAEFRKSMEIDPLLVFPNMGAAFALTAAKRYDEALTHYNRALELNSTFEDVWWDKGMCLSYMGRKQEALACFRKAGELDGATDWHPHSAVNAFLGNTETAMRQLKIWEAEAVNRPDEYLNIARVYGVLGDAPNAVKWVERAWTTREPQLVWLKMDPRFDRVRSAPGFQAVMRRLGL